MPEHVPGLLGALARRLPPRALDRWFLPTWHELRSAHVAAAAGRPAPARILLALGFRCQVLGALLQCAVLAWRERARPGGQTVSLGVDPMLAHDLRFAVRLLVKAPGFSLAAITTLALGIGANTAMFSVVHAVLLRPLPYADPERIVTLHETGKGNLTTISPPNLLDWKAQATSFERIAAYDDTSVTLTGGFEPERMAAALVSSDLFPALGVPPLMGRWILPAEERAGARRVVVLGYQQWQRRLNGDPAVVGRTLTFDGLPHEIVGVMPPGFTFPDETDLWFPLVLTDADLRPSQRGAHYMNAVGRLKPGVTVAQAIAELTRIEEGLAAQYAAVQGYGVWAQPILDTLVGGVRKPLFVLLGAVAFVLLIACVNVSNLLLARAGARRGEIALRAALGASRGRLVRQLLAESLMLACAGGAAGLLLALWAVRALDSLVPADLPRAAGIGLDTTVLLFATLATLATGLLFGIVPALQAAGGNPGAALKDVLREGSSGRRAFRQGLVAVEVALAIVLLAGAGLALRTFARLSAIDTGFNATSVLSASVAVPEARYPDHEAVALFYSRLIEAMTAQPGVVAAGAVMMAPLARASFVGTFSIEGAPESDDLGLQVRAVTPGYLEALQIPIRRGRSFTPHDRRGSAPVVIITEEAARRYWPGQNPIGQRLRLHVNVSGREPMREIVGVAGDVTLRAIEAAPVPAAYVPHGQYVVGGMTVFARSQGDPLALVPVLKAALSSIDPEVPLTRIRPAGQMVEGAVAQPRFRMWLLSFFAGTALLLAMIGLYGVMAYSVAQRRTEIGVRIALGAEPSKVVSLVLREAMKPVAIGVAAGLAGAFALTRVMSGLLYGVSALDPLTYGTVVAGLSAAAALASYLPARRAARIDPLVALRAS